MNKMETGFFTSGDDTFLNNIRNETRHVRTALRRLGLQNFQPAQDVPWYHRWKTAVDEKLLADITAAQWNKSVEGVCKAAILLRKATPEAVEAAYGEFADERKYPKAARSPRDLNSHQRIKTYTYS
jgi:hypothetical protein